MNDRGREPTCAQSIWEQRNGKSESCALIAAASGQLPNAAVTRCARASAEMHFAETRMRSSAAATKALFAALPPTHRCGGPSARIFESSRGYCGTDKMTSKQMLPTNFIDAITMR
jgi:hypothetical protein